MGASVRGGEGDTYNPVPSPEIQQIGHESTRVPL